MNKMTRVLVMTGMALFAGATMGAGPASAAPATTTPGTPSADHWSPGHDQVVNYYRNPFMCERAGRIGEQHNRWDSHDCNQVRGGFRRGWWALTVSWDHHGHGHGHGHGHDLHGLNDQHGHDQHGHDQHGHDQHGDNQHGHDQHGQDQHGDNQHGHDQHGQDQHGHDQHDGGHRP